MLPLVQAFIFFSAALRHNYLLSVKIRFISFIRVLLLPNHSTTQFTYPTPH